MGTENWGKGVKGKRWKEFRRNRFLRVWVRCVKCDVFAQVLVWNEEER